MRKGKPALTLGFCVSVKKKREREKCEPGKVFLA